MATKRENLTLYGGEAKKFRELRDELADELGYDCPEDVSKPDVVQHLLQHYDGPLLD